MFLQCVITYPFPKKKKMSALYFSQRTHNANLTVIYLVGLIHFYYSDFHHPLNTDLSTIILTSTLDVSIFSNLIHFLW